MPWACSVCVTVYYYSACEYFNLVGVPFPRNYMSSVKKIMTRLFRVFVHIYIHHFDKLVGIGAVSNSLSIWLNINRCFAATENISSVYKIILPVIKIFGDMEHLVSALPVLQFIPWYSIAATCRIAYESVAAESIGVRLWVEPTPSVICRSAVGRSTHSAAATCNKLIFGSVICRNVLNLVGATCQHMLQAFLLLCARV